MPWSRLYTLQGLSAQVFHSLPGLTLRFVVQMPIGRIAVEAEVHESFCRAQPVAQARAGEKEHRGKQGEKKSYEKRGHVGESDAGFLYHWRTARASQARRNTQCGAAAATSPTHVPV